MYEGDSELSYTEVSLFNISWKWFSEYRITWEARNSTEKVEMTQIEVPGLLGKDSELAIHSIPRSFKGSWHSNLLQYSNDVEIFNGFVYERSCNYCKPSWGLASFKIFDGSTNRFKMGLHGGRIPALSFRPNDGRYSITSGMRIYMGEYFDVRIMCSLKLCALSKTSSRAQRTMMAAPTLKGI